MGRLNELLGAAGNYSRGIAIQLGLEEQEGVPTVAPELVPVLDIHSRPEQWALHGGSLLWGRSTTGAVAGAQSQAQIMPGEGELLILEGIMFVPSNLASTINVALSSVALTDSTGNLVSRDARRIMTAGGSGASGSRILQQSFGVAADIASMITQIILTSNGQPVWYPMDMVLVRPWTVKIWQQTLNQALEQHNFICRARPATPRELSIGAL